MLVLTVEADGARSGRNRACALDIAFAGPTLAATLARGVEGFVEAVTDIHPSVEVTERTFAARAATPSGLLLAVLEECLRCRLDGRVAIGMAAPEVDGDVVRGRLDTVAADDPHVQPRLGAVVSWHEVTLEESPVGGWSGRIVAR